MNEAEFNEEFERLVMANMPAPVASLSAFIYKSHKTTFDDSSPEVQSAVLQCASLLNLDCMAAFMGVKLENISPEDLKTVEPSVTIAGKKLYYSVHLLHKTMVVRSATSPGVYNGFAELDLKDFGLVAN